MRIQVVNSCLLLDPGCDVGADFLVIKALVDWAITNKLLVYFFILLGGALSVDWEYSVRLVITAMLVICFVRLYTGLW